MSLYNSPWKSIRIGVDYDYTNFDHALGGDSSISEATKQWLKDKVINPVLDLTMRLLKVKRVVGPLDLNNTALDYCSSE